MRLVRARDDEQARRVAVEPVDDSRPLRLLAARDRVAEQPVDERPARVAGRRMHDDARRLVDDEQVLVLVGDAQVELLGLEARRAPLRQLEVELAPRPPAGGSSICGCAVDEDAPLGEQPLGGRARADLFERGEEAVEPLARRLGRDGRARGQASVFGAGAPKECASCAAGAPRRRAR